MKEYKIKWRKFSHEHNRAKQVFEAQGLVERNLLWRYEWEIENGKGHTVLQFRNRAELASALDAKVMELRNWGMDIPDIPLPDKDNKSYVWINKDSFLHRELWTLSKVDYSRHVYHERPKYLPTELPPEGQRNPPYLPSFYTSVLEERGDVHEFI